MSGLLQGSLYEYGGRIVVLESGSLSISHIKVAHVRVAVGVSFWSANCILGLADFLDSAHGNAPTTFNLVDTSIDGTAAGSGIFWGFGTGASTLHESLTRTTIAPAVPAGFDPSLYTSTFPNWFTTIGRSSAGFTRDGSRVPSYSNISESNFLHVRLNIAPFCNAVVVDSHFDSTAVELQTGSEVLVERSVFVGHGGQFTGLHTSGGAIRVSSSSVLHMADSSITGYRVLNMGCSGHPQTSNSRIGSYGGAIYGGRYNGGTFVLTNVSLVNNVATASSCSGLAGQAFGNGAFCSTTSTWAPGSQLQGISYENGVGLHITCAGT
jgi:hypothetical protein